MIEADKEDDDIGCDQLFNCREVMLVNIFRLTPTKSEVIGFQSQVTIIWIWIIFLNFDSDDYWL